MGISNFRDSSGRAGTLDASHIQALLLTIVATSEPVQDPLLLLLLLVVVVVVVLVLVVEAEGGNDADVDQGGRECLAASSE